MQQHLIRIHVPGNISLVSNNGICFCIQLYFKKKSHGKEAEIVDPCAQQHSKQISIFSCKHVAILKEFVIRIYKKLQI